MLSSGDVQGCLRKLESLLRLIKFPGDVDYSGLSKGEPAAFLPVVSFTLTSFSPLFAEQLMVDGLALAGKSDLGFTDTLFKVLRDVFHYKPVLSKQQFLQRGFSQRKISFICDVIELVLQKHAHLVKARVRGDGRAGGQPTVRTTTGTVRSRREIPAARKENSSPSSTSSFHPEAFTSHDMNPNPEGTSSTFPEKAAGGPGGGGNLVPVSLDRNSYANKIHQLKLSDVEGRLSELETRLDSVLCGLGKLGVLEKRLEELERRQDASEKEGPVLTVRRKSWEHLMSRVLLLETKLELSSKPVI